MKQSSLDEATIPEYVTRVTDTLGKAGFEAYLVGGCVRDIIMSRIPKDWDVTTNASPEQIQGLFEKTIYENTFGTVGVCILRDVTHETPEYDIVEVTPYRIEATYSDFRHPDQVKFSQKIEDDLKRRDFTINAMAYKDNLVDLYNGHQDLKDKVLRTVGEPRERFTEDALRMLRAVRFSCQLGFTISSETMQGIVENSSKLKNISAERIRDEFIKIIESPDPVMGIGLLAKLGLLHYIVPELEEGIGCEQGGAHVFDVFQHLLQALDHAKEKEWSFEIRLAALFHDIGKPRSRRLRGAEVGTSKLTRSGHSQDQKRIFHGLGIVSEDLKNSFPDPVPKKPYTFYGHEVIGARMSAKIMERLKFPKDITEKVVKLVRYHMFFSDTEQITLSAVRRTIVNIGRENIWELMKIRECDRVGMKKKEAPYRLRKYHAMIEEALRAPTTVGMLKIDGLILKNDLGIAPGPRMGWMLHTLLEECLENDEKNNLEFLKERVLELNKLSDKELKALGEKGKERKEETEEKEIEELRKKHGVK